MEWKAPLWTFYPHPGTKIFGFWSIKAAIEATSEDFFWYHNKERIGRDIYMDVIWPPEQTIDVKRYPSLGVGEAFKRRNSCCASGGSIPRWDIGFMNTR